MRIRKHASMILGTRSSLPAQAAAAPDASSYGYICVLSQSPWDVLPSCEHIPPPPHKHNPQDAGEELIGNGMKGDETLSANTSTMAMLNTEIATRRDWSGNMEAEHCSKLNPPPTQPSKKAKGMRVSVKKEKMCFGSTAPTFACKKTDGKQWRCKQPAHKPNSLCDYHLAQIKSYSYKVPLVAKVSNACKSTQKKRTKRPTATSAVSEIYYYSSFGPWRGKKRGGEDISQHLSVVATADEESDSEGESCDYMDGSGKLDGKQYTDPLMGSRQKRMKKPVKSRSLKSLM